MANIKLSSHRAENENNRKSDILFPAAILCPKVKTAARWSSMVSNILYERPHTVSAKTDRPPHGQVRHLVSSSHFVAKNETITQDCNAWYQTSCNYAYIPFLQK